MKVSENLREWPESHSQVFINHEMNVMIEFYRDRVDIDTSEIVMQITDSDSNTQKTIVLDSYDWESLMSKI